jgi:hypothetical protein
MMIRPAKYRDTVDRWIEEAEIEATLRELPEPQDSDLWDIVDEEIEAMMLENIE